eukprot:scpid39925/ scgid1625/ Beta-galactosidase 8; Protein AR782
MASGYRLLLPTLAAFLSLLASGHAAAARYTKSEEFVNDAAAGTVDIDWTTVVAISKTTTTLQVVVNPLLRRESPVHDAMYQSLSELKADYVRYVPWLPYPKLGVAELDPPSGTNLCRMMSGEEGNNETTSLSCGTGKISKIDFASYGTPTGSCGSLVLGKCHAENSTSIVSSYCLGKSQCTIPVNSDVFGDPCVNTVKQFAVQVECNPQMNHTYWDFSVIDPMTEDFMNATQDHTVIINFSTIPAWLYKTPARVVYPDNPDRESSPGYTQGTELVDETGQDLGDYYGRLVSYYTQGGFTDEYGVQHKSDYNYDFQYWECLNEVESEHRNTPETYTKVYDYMVQGIRRHADPERKMKFVGMALEGHHEYSWYTYFLNISNHVSHDIPLDIVSFHFYASCSSRTDPTTYTQFFSRADGFVDECKQIVAIRDALSPHTLLDVDETGVILPGDNSPNAPMFPLVYYNAAGAMYAYLFGKLAEIGVEILGESQLVGYPELPELHLQPQFPSVAMLNWTNGLGNARYHVLKVLIENFQPGDKLVKTTAVQSSKPGPVGPDTSFCGRVPNLDVMNLKCTDPTATIDKILFASYGTVKGYVCGQFEVGTCNAANSTDIVEKACLGKNTCSIDANTPLFGDPCYKVVKNLVVEAHCSKGSGTASGGQSSNVYAQAFMAFDGSRHRVLLVNKTPDSLSVIVPGASGSTAIIVDDTRPTGPAINTKLTSDTVQMRPYAVFVLIMSE